jgi:hypothetical protein
MTAEVVLHILRAFALVLLFMPLSFPSAASKPLNRDSGRSLLGAAKSKLSSRSRMAYWRLPTAFGPETLVLRMHGGVSHFAMEYSCNGVTIGEFSSPSDTKSVCVLTRSPQHEGPLMPGDEIVLVDGVPAWQLGPEGVSAMLDCDEDVVNVEVKRDDTTLSLPVRRQDLAGQWKWNGKSCRWETHDPTWNQTLNCKYDVIDAIDSMYERDHLSETQIKAALETAENELGRGVEDTIMEKAANSLLHDLEAEPFRQQQLERMCCMALAGLCSVSVRLRSIALLRTWAFHLCHHAHM